MRMNNNEVRDMLKAYPELHYKHEMNADIFEGIITICYQEANSKTILYGDFNLRIVISNEYPQKLPEVFDIGNSIKQSYVHRYPNGGLCLESRYRLQIYSRNHSSREFIDLFLMNYLYSYLFYDRYLKYPNGDRPHDSEGELDFLSEYYNVELSTLLKILQYMTEREVRRNDACPCGSGKLIKRCHGKKMITLMNVITIDDLRCVYNAYQFKRWKRYINGSNI